MKNKNILFRANSSSIIGTGHVMRDLVLASKYKNANIIFACENLDGNINNKIIEEKYKIEILKSNKLNELIKIIHKYNIDMIIIDSYDIDYKFEKKLKTKTDVEILSLDDTYEKHHCDILLNHNISAKKKKYKNLVPKNCKIKCGSKYTLLREEFYNEKKRVYKKKSKNTNIFLAMGGADTSQLNIPILKILLKFKKIKVNIVTTNANANIKKLEKYCKNKSWIKVHIDSKKIAKLIAKSNLTIITPSVIANEVYFMNKEIIAIKTANNQSYIYDFLKKKKFNTIKKFNMIQLNNIIRKIFNENNL